jgi:hypothetical protein
MRQRFYCLGEVFDLIHQPAGLIGLDELGSGLFS